ncbi:MAG: DUF4124 domain-containing protein [bacterium]
MGYACLLLVALGLATPALAGDVYRWVDANGVVHFADVPSAGARQVQTQSMPPPPTRPTGEAAAADAPAAEAGTPVPATGPARVVVTRQNEESLGSGSHGYRGAVKNEGGTAAHDVAITIRVVEPQQGQECLNDEIAVEPSTLGPGETGVFSANFNNPCFAGTTQTAYEVVWD